VQRWRARSSAILTGSGTVLADDPRLTVRLPSATAESSPQDAIEPHRPLRVVLDRHLRTPRGANALDRSAPTLIVHAQETQPSDARFAEVELAGVSIDADGRLDLAEVLSLLAKHGINELQVEAGPTLCGAFLQGALVDELLVYVAPIVLGDRARPLLALPELATMASARRLRAVDRRCVGADERILYRDAL
jgi:diaminohydroxyphosphoribosylaminopyrimidine deaminase / 5-amino-6-(5-phosphoribosylamino)uracil reductase